MLTPAFRLLLCVASCVLALALPVRSRPASARAAPAQHRHRLCRRSRLRRHRQLQHAHRRRQAAYPQPRSHGGRGHPPHQLLRRAGGVLRLARGAPDRLLFEPRRHQRRAEPSRDARHQSRRDHDRRGAEAARLRDGDFRQVAPRAREAVPAARTTASTSTSGLPYSNDMWPRHPTQKDFSGSAADRRRHGRRSSIPTSRS